MKNIRYPSKTFKKDFDLLISEEADFIVSIDRNSNKKGPVVKKLDAAMHNEPDKGPILSSIVNMFRVTDFLTCFAEAWINKKYRVRYEDKGDLYIYFEEPGSGSGGL